MGGGMISGSELQIWVLNLGFLFKCVKEVLLLIVTVKNVRFLFAHI